MDRPRSLLAFEVKNAVFDHRVNHLGALDVTVGEFYSVTFGQPSTHDYKFGGPRWGGPSSYLSLSVAKRMMLSRCLFSRRRHCHTGGELNAVVRTTGPL